MNIFFDSSALVKRYLEEPGSDKVEKLCAKADHIMVSMICLPEVVSALNRKTREGLITPHQYGVIKQRLGIEFEDFMTCPLTEQVIIWAIGFLEKFPLRAMDALHLASAFEIKADLFVSADRKQLLTAKKLKFKIHGV